MDEIMKSLADTIGKTILTIKIYEHGGNNEEAEKYKRQLESFESQLDKMISIRFPN
jgi:hypothetical protein